VYSNAVTEEEQAKLLSWLQQQGFKEVGTKHAASVRLVQRGTNSGYTLSFVKTGNG
jgi:hypothetical protein